MSTFESYFLMLLLGVVFALIHVVVIRSGRCSGTIGVFFVFMIFSFFFNLYLHMKIDEGWDILHDILRMASSSVSYFISLVVLHIMKLY